MTRLNNMKVSFYSFTVIIFAVVLLSTTLCGAVLDPEMSRYKVIVERDPFGNVSHRSINSERDQKKSAEPQQPQKSFALDWKLTVVTTGPYGVRVGLHNKNSKLNYFAYVGDECEDGVVVQNADFEKETVTLAKDGYEETLGMYSMPVSAVASKSPTARNRNWTRSSRPDTSKMEDEYYKNVMSRAEYLKKRYSQPRPSSPRSSLRGGTRTDENLTEEEKKANIRLYNMDLIRAGGAAGVPLPIELTPEEDATLVAEGVLPPL